MFEGFDRIETLRRGLSLYGIKLLSPPATVILALIGFGK